MSLSRLKSYEFRKERERSWRELEDLLTQAGQSGLHRLSEAQLSRLPVLYRAAVSSLSVARSISLDRNLLDYLEGLVTRAYFQVYGVKRHPRQVIAEFFGSRWPQSVRRFRGPILLSFACMALGVLVGWVLTLQEPDRFYAFVSAEYAQSRSPLSSTEDLREVLYDGADSAADQLSAFASYLFTHNARIGMLCMALGAVAGVPVFLMMVQNGLLLGAFAALYHSRGLGLEFWGWVLPHGVTELLALILSGAGGFALGGAVLFPGRQKRRGRLIEQGRAAAGMMLGSVLMFLMAGLIEGIFRQRVHLLEARWALAILTALAWAIYFGRVGRTRDQPLSSEPQHAGASSHSS